MIAWLGMALNNPLSVRLTLEAPGADAEMFYNINHQGFHQIRRRGWRQPEKGSLEVDFHFHTLGPMTEIRIDPNRQPDQPVVIGTVEMVTPWANWTLSGQALYDAIHRHKHLQFNEIGEDRLWATSTGSDSQIVLRLPEHLIQRPMGQQLAWLLGGLIAGGLLGVTGARARQLAPPGWRPRWGAMAMVMACGLLTVQSWPLITDRSIFGDGVQNATITYNLWQHGVFSHETGNPPEPSNWREPLPQFVAAGYLAVVLSPDQNAHLTPHDFTHGEHALTLKHSHLLWVFLGLLGVWVLVHRITGSHVAGLMATGLSWLYFFGYPGRLDTFYTELQTGALLVWTSVALHGLATSRRLIWALAAGLLMGLLALVKAIAFYVALVAIPLLAFTLWRDRWPAETAAKPTGQSALVLGLALVVGLSAAILPWMVRNLITVEAASIADRGGLILYGRSVLNHMSYEEVTGVFYMHGPQFYRRLVAGTSLGQAPGDLQRGGRWQRLNRGASDFSGDDMQAQLDGRPEDAISFHRQVSAEYVRRTRAFQDAGHSHPRLAAGDAMKQEAIADIRAHLPRHLAMSVPFLWRGFWGVPPTDWPVFSLGRQQQLMEAINLAGGLALLCGFLWGLLRGHARLLAWTLMAGGLMMAYAILTHNIPRYLAPTHPLMMVALVSVGWLAAAALWQTLRRRLAGPTSG